MKFFLFFFSCILLSACSQNVDTQPDNSSITQKTQNEQVLQKPNFQNIQENELLIVPKINNDSSELSVNHMEVSVKTGIFAYRNLNKNKEGALPFFVWDFGMNIGVKMDNPNTQAQISLETNTQSLLKNTPEIITGVNIWNSDYVTNLEKIYNKKIDGENNGGNPPSQEYKEKMRSLDVPFAYEVDDLYAVEKRENSIFSEITTKKSEKSSEQDTTSNVLLYQEALLNNDIIPSKIFFDFENIRNVSTESMSIVVSARGNDDTINTTIAPKITLVKNDGTKEVLNKIYFNVSIQNPPPIDKSYLCDQGLCIAKLKKETYKNLAYVEVSWKDAKTFTNPDSNSIYDF